MAIVALFNDVPGMTAEIYDRTLPAIDEAGKNVISQRSHHVSAPTPNGGWFVCDVWESMEAFETFGTTLMPILAEAGVDVDAVEPQIYQVHNTIVPQAALR